MITLKIDCRCHCVLKVSALVLGCLLVGTGLAMHFSNVNVTAASVAGGLGGVTIIGIVIWSLAGCRVSNGTQIKNVVSGFYKKESTSNMSPEEMKKTIDCLFPKEKIGVEELILDLTDETDHPTITEEKIDIFINENPNLRTLTIYVTPHSNDPQWSPDFKALKKYFGKMSMCRTLESNKLSYVYYRT